LGGDTPRSYSVSTGKKAWLVKVEGETTEDREANAGSGSWSELGPRNGRKTVKKQAPGERKAPMFIRFLRPLGKRKNEKKTRGRGVSSGTLHPDTLKVEDKGGGLLPKRNGREASHARETLAQAGGGGDAKKDRGGGKNVRFDLGCASPLGPKNWKGRQRLKKTSNGRGLRGNPSSGLWTKEGIATDYKNSGAHRKKKKRGRVTQKGKNVTIGT